MTCFYQMDPTGQILLLIGSLVTIITLSSCCILVFRHRYDMPAGFNLWGIGLLLLNIILYVPMQLDSRITAGSHSPQLALPAAVPTAVVLFSMGYAVRAILQETSRRNTLNNTSIKEAFDNLPTGVCFFNEMGLPVLCNRAMHRFSFAAAGRDIQFITDLQDCLSEDFVPAEGTRKDGKVFMLADGSVWNLESRTIRDGSGAIGTQFLAMDITDLHRNRIELTEENARLRRVQADLKRLSANVVAITREEEILNTKMRIHDEIGRCLMEVQKYLRDGSGGTIPDSVAVSWKRVLSTLQYNSDAREEDMLDQIRKTCASVGLHFDQKGQLPEEGEAAYILTCAVRECVTNAVRYAEATALYVRFSEDAASAAVEVTNNGKPPEKEITEGGGLSNLRRRAERAGGTMQVQSLPVFRLTVTVPKGKVGMK